MRHRARILSGLIAGGLVLCSGSAWADTTLMYGEYILSGGVYNGDVDVMRSHPQTSVGFDWLHKYATDEGDWATAGAQFRFIVEAETDRLEPDLMTAFFQVRGDNGRANWRVGKFEIPYGLEPVLDTHGTLLQSNGHHNLGDLWSWGAELNGQLDEVDYRIAALTGDFSEMLPQASQESWLLAGRVGAPRSDGADAWGGSLAIGRTVPSMHSEHVSDEPHDDGGHGAAQEMDDDMEIDREAAVDITRLGVDFTRWEGDTTWYAEGSVGTDDGDPMASAWLRWEQTPLDNDRLTYALQAEGVWHPPDMQDDFLEVSGSIRYRLTPELSVSALAGHAFDTITGDPEDRVLLQFYYFGIQ